jgi:hypothetical protein
MLNNRLSDIELIRESSGISLDDDCRTNRDLVEIIEKIGGKLSYVASGAYGHFFNVDNKYGVKMIPHTTKLFNYDGCDDIDRPEYTESRMMILLSELVSSSKTPHIILPICAFKTSSDIFLEHDDINSTRYKHFIDRCETRHYSDSASIIIMELANHGDFLDYIKKHINKLTLLHWKCLFFQIISVLAIVQYKYPSFRHNNFKANNILVSKIDTHPHKFNYTVSRKKYVLPNIGYSIMMADFDFAYIDKHCENKRVTTEWTTNLNVRPTQNKYYDLHFFFNSLPGFAPWIMSDSVIPQEVKEFISRVVPDKYKKNTTVGWRTLYDDEYTTPGALLENDVFFADFRKSDVIKDTRANAKVAMMESKEFSSDGEGNNDNDKFDNDDNDKFDNDDNDKFDNDYNDKFDNDDNDKFDNDDNEGDEVDENDNDLF